MPHSQATTPRWVLEWGTAVMLLGYEPPEGLDKTWKAVHNDSRFNHTWVLGKTGVGKSNFLINSAITDILNGEGVAFFDPHGDAIDTIIKHVPPDKVILFDPSDTEFPIGFNPLHNVTDFPFVAGAILDTFKSIWGHSWGVQLEQYLYNGISALVETPDGTLVGLKYLITSDRYRNHVMSFVSNPIIKDFWDTDFDVLMPDREKRQNTLSTLNKIGALISDPKIRNILGQPKSTINFKDIMDNNKCLLIRLPQGKLGIEKSKMLGALLMAQLHLTALSRDTRQPFHIYADEAHNFGTSTIEKMLAEIRKYNVSVVFANQFIAQLNPSLQNALVGTVGSIVAFKLGISDAEYIAKEMTARMIQLHPRDITELPPFTVWAKANERVYYLTTYEVDFPVLPDSPRRIKHSAHEQYGRRRLWVESKINRFIRGTK